MRGQGCPRYNGGMNSSDTDGRTTCQRKVYVRKPLPEPLPDRRGLQQNTYVTRLCRRKTYGERYCFQHREKK